MKNILLLSILFLSLSLHAQTPFTILSSHDYLPATISATSANNPWVGAKLAYNVSGDVSQSFLLSARALYIAASGDKWALPVVANVGLNTGDSLSNDDGVSLGLFPYYILSGTERMTLVMHGGLNYHVKDKLDASVSEFRLMAGLEVALFPDDMGSPTTLSVAPEYIMNSGLGDDNRWNLSITGVLPIANGLGFLAEGNIPLNGSPATGFRLGVIVNSNIK